MRTARIIARRYTVSDAVNLRAEAEVETRKRTRLAEQPDTLETAGGFCPNYEKLETLFDMTPERALAWCNMD